MSIPAEAIQGTEIQRQRAAAKREGRVEGMGEGMGELEERGRQERGCIVCKDEWEN